MTRASAGVSAGAGASPARATPPSPVCTAVVGLQWGDEGKGKIIDLIASDHDAVVRYNGGANAGNSVVVGGERYALHLVPTGILHPGRLCVIGNGVVVDPQVLIREIEGLEARGVDTGGLVVSDRAHVVLPYHKLEDGLREDFLRHAAGGGAGSGPLSTVGHIGTTRRGIGPAYADKVQRSAAVRIGDLLRPEVLRERVELALVLRHGMFDGLIQRLGGDGEGRRLPPADEIVAAALEAGERLRPRIRDTTWMLHDLLRDGRRLLFAGANAALLDVDHGTYPFVTSSNATVLGAGPGTGVPGAWIGRTIGVVKAYSTRVGGGPFPTETSGEGRTEGEDHAAGVRMREVGREYGTTTGRPRRIGWLDLVAVRYGAMINGVTELAVTLLDVLSCVERVRVCVSYRLADGRETDRFPPDAATLAGVTPVYETFPGLEDVSGVRDAGSLPEVARRYLAFIESFVGLPVTLVGVGAGRDAVVRR